MNYTKRPIKSGKNNYCDITIYSTAINSKIRSSDDTNILIGVIGDSTNFKNNTAKVLAKKAHRLNS